MDLLTHYTVPMTQDNLFGKEEENFFALDDGTPLDEAMSTYQKAIRRGDEELAVYFGYNIYQRFPKVFWKRTITIASEDVGNADPQAAILIAALHHNWEFIKKESKYSTGNVFVMQAVFYLLRCAKNRETDNVLPWIRQRMADGWKPEVPDYALDKHTKRGKRMGRDATHFFGEGSVLANEQGTDNYKGKFDASRA